MDDNYLTIGNGGRALSSEQPIAVKELHGNIDYLNSMNQSGEYDYYIKSDDDGNFLVKSTNINVDKSPLNTWDDENNPTTQDEYVIESNLASVAIGNNCIATGYDSLAFGKNCEATNSRAVAIGNGNKAYANSAFVIGQVNIGGKVNYNDDGKYLSESGAASFTGGNNNTNFGNRSLVFGTSNQVLAATNSIIFGNTNKIEGNTVGSAIFGTGNSISSDKILDVGIIAGRSNSVSGVDKIVIGNYLNGHNTIIALGSCNKDSEANFLEIGQGSSNTDTDRFNVIEITNDRNLNINSPTSTLKNINTNQLTINGNYGIQSKVLRTTHTQVNLLDPNNTVTIDGQTPETATNVSVFSVGAGHQWLGGRPGAAIGSYLIKSGEQQVVIGYNNKQDDDAAFIIGRGTNIGVGRKNIFTVKNDGSIINAGSAEIAGNTIINGALSVNSDIITNDDGTSNNNRENIFECNKDHVKSNVEPTDSNDVIRKVELDELRYAEIYKGNSIAMDLTGTYRKEFISTGGGQTISGDLTVTGTVDGTATNAVSAETANKTNKIIMKNLAVGATVTETGIYFVQLYSWLDGSSLSTQQVFYIYDISEYIGAIADEGNSVPTVYVHYDGSSKKFEINNSAARIKTIYYIPLV